MKDHRSARNFPPRGEATHSYVYLPHRLKTEKKKEKNKKEKKERENKRIALHILPHNVNIQILARVLMMIVPWINSR